MNKNLLTRDEIKNKILEVIKGNKLAALATIANGKPWVRFAMCHSDGLKLYICTYRDSRKVKQIKNNPNVHIAVMKDSNKIESAYVQIIGRSRIRSDYKIRKKYWQDFMKKYYSGINDPQYVVIEVKPQLIEYKDREIQQAQIYKP